MAGQVVAQVQGGVVIGAPFALAEGCTAAQSFPPAIAAKMVAVPAGVTVEDGYVYANGVFSAPPASAATQAQLLAYANAKQWALASGGYMVTIAGQALLFATDLTSQALITGKAVRFGQANPPASVDWQFPSGFVTIAAADFMSAAIRVADFIQATFNTLQVVLAAIASGSITTTAQIDAAAWPSTVSSTAA